MNASTLQTAQRISGHTDTECLLKALQTSLEVESVLQAFTHFVQAKLPLATLEFDNENLHYSLLHGPEPVDQCVSTARQLELNNNSLGTLVYHFSSSLTAPQTVWLDEAEACLLYPLYNALQFRVLRHQAVRDHLTNLGNRVLLEEVLEQLLTEQERNHKPHAVMLLDLDNFKAVNDSHGHGCGDQVLAEFAAILRQQLRGSDRLFRYGGDEFLIVVNGPDENTLHRIFRRLQLCVDAHSLLRKHHITCSGGAVFIKPAHDAKSLLEDADKALYHAKRNGRDQLITPGTLSFTQLG